MKQLESTLKRGLTRLYKEHYGKGPDSTSVSIIGNILIVKISGAMSQVEQTLISTSEEKQLVLKIRDELILEQRSFASEIEAIVGQSITEICYALDQKNNVLYTFRIFDEDVQVGMD